MSFKKVRLELPKYDKRVLVKTDEDFYFTAKLLRDEDGDFWVFDLPANSDEIINENIIAWSYLPLP